MDVAIQVFSYKERELEDTLDEYEKLNIPGFVDNVAYHACVTPRDSYMPRMAEHAESHSTFEMIQTPSGKLSSRNHAHDLAMEQGYDVIVSGDGDAPPTDRDYLHALLGPFREPGVVATTGLQYDENPVTFPITHTFYYADQMRKPIYGRSSAFTVEGWRHAGPFADVDQTDVYSTRGEEEFDFRRRLEEIGEFRMVSDARVHTDLRRVKCKYQKQWNKIGRPMSPYCERSGTETFHPRR